jgi:integrase
VLGLDAVRADLLAGTTRADHRLLLLLAGVHVLSRAEITGLRIDDVDLAARRLRVRGRWVTLDQPTHQHLRAWTDERRTRWPGTANPHLFITGVSACNLAPVSAGYLRGLPIPLARLRADRLLAAAADSNRDPLTLVRLFSLSGDTAVRYCAELDPPDPAT